MRYTVYSHYSGKRSEPIPAGDPRHRFFVRGGWVVLEVQDDEPALTPETATTDEGQGESDELEGDAADTGSAVLSGEWGGYRGVGDDEPTG